MNRRNTLLAACGLVLAVSTTILPASAAEPIKVVYQLTEGLDQATRALVDCRTWGVESENQPQPDQFLPERQAHSSAMGQKDGEKWDAAADLQPTTPKSDRLLGNIRNHLQAEPDTKIVVVTNGEGMRFLLAGARERNGKLFDESVAALAERGVAFRVCSNTLVAYQVPESRLLPQAQIVTSGVVEASRLQAREGYAYLRP